MIRVLVLALALAADATAVAAGMGAAGRGASHVLQAAVLFGVFQGGMAGLGAGGGTALVAWIGAFDHWIAFLLLLGIGGRTAWKAWQGEDEEDEQAEGWMGLLLLAVATSIDALAAGITLPAMAFPVVPAAGVIGVVTFVTSALGGAAGRRLGETFGRNVQILGGLTLCAIGVHTLVDHLTHGT
ncbi:MAG: manganese efflux pump [Myxococcales bacterium]|nr:manganese efflux pump [Myxococcales bacterium]